MSLYAVFFRWLISSELEKGVRYFKVTSVDVGFKGWVLVDTNYNYLLKGECLIHCFGLKYSFKEIRAYLFERFDMLSFFDDAGLVIVEPSQVDLYEKARAFNFVPNLLSNKKDLSSYTYEIKNEEGLFEAANKSNTNEDCMIYINRTPYRLEYLREALYDYEYFISFDDDRMWIDNSL